jgi:hypothetical protein
MSPLEKPLLAASQNPLGQRLEACTSICQELEAMEVALQYGSNKKKGKKRDKKAVAMAY